MREPWLAPHLGETRRAGEEGRLRALAVAAPAIGVAPAQQVGVAARFARNRTPGGALPVDLSQ
jgi:hypothetical protein